jgi:hypothetical protein
LAVILSGCALPAAVPDAPAAGPYLPMLEARSQELGDAYAAAELRVLGSRQLAVEDLRRLGTVLRDERKNREAFGRP